jgi:twitching motility protein PilT
MKSLEKLLRNLERPEVEEVALVSGRLPSARIGASFDPLDEEPMSSDSILAALVAVGGSRYVDDLGPKPKQWAARLPGVGSVTVSASQKGAQVLARFALVARPEEDSPAPTPRVEVRRSTKPATPAARASMAPGARGSARSVRPPARASHPPKSTPASVPGEGKRRSLPPSKARRDSVSAKRASIPAKKEEGPESASAFRRAPTAPAFPRARDLRGAQDLVLDTPSTDILLHPHVHVKDAASDPSKAWDPEADTKPGASSNGWLGDLQRLLEHAREAKASDLHVVAGRAPLFRVGGELRPRGQPLGPEEVGKMIRPLVPSRLTSTLDELGSCDFAIDVPKLGRFRVNVGRQQTGLKACLRLIPLELPTIAALGLPPELSRATTHHQGLVVFTGPTGHGKSTSLTAVVDLINETTTHHVITVEDPVENVHPKKKALISQREVGTHTKTFASALRAALREDPDVIVVGELRDAETVRMAVAASETGHLVLGTMNTPSAAKTIDRLIDLFPPADQPQVRLTLASGLRLIVGQRLVPSPDRSRVHAAVELLPGSVPLSAIIRDNKTFQIPSLQQRGRGHGIVRLDESLADLVKTGRAKPEDALAVAESPQELDTLLKGKPQAAALGVR